MSPYSNISGLDCESCRCPFSLFMIIFAMVFRCTIFLITIGYHMGEGGVL
jgi:hypothetical protein